MLSQPIVTLVPIRFLQKPTDVVWKWESIERLQWAVVLWSIADRFEFPPASGIDTDALSTENFIASPVFCNIPHLCTGVFHFMRAPATSESRLLCEMYSFFRRDEMRTAQTTRLQQLCNRKRSSIDHTWTVMALNIGRPMAGKRESAPLYSDILSTDNSRVMSGIRIAFSSYSSAIYSTAAVFNALNVDGDIRS